MSPQALPFDTLGDLEPVFDDLLERKPTWEEKHEFLKSKELRGVPYIDIYVELRASMIWENPDRNPRGSDLEDVMAASLALPYCDVYTTDRYMKHLISQRDLAQQYKVEIFSPTQTDMSSLTSVVSGILSE